jgi:hypothetical protein
MTLAVNLAQGASNNVTFRNRIINGAMVIDQRNAGASSVPATGSYTYTSLDRYFTSVNTPATSTAIQSTTVPTGFLYSLKIGRSGTGTAGLNTFGQVIETNNSQDLASSAVTLSFWAKVGASATFSTMSANIYSGTVANQTAATLRSGWTGQATVATNGSVALTTTWQQFSITGSVGSTALQLAVQFIFTTVGTAGADDNLYITGVQLEAGTTASPFEYRQYGTELALCQRYFWKIGGTTVYEQIAMGLVDGGSNVSCITSLPVAMRTAPSVGYSSASAFQINDAAVQVVTTAVAIYQPALQTTGIVVTVAPAPLTLGRAARFFIGNSLSAYINFSAEL